MTSKEFDLLMALLIKLLEEGKTQEVLELLKETRNKND